MTDMPSPMRAVFWMCGALVSFMAMAVSGRELSVELNTFQILFFRSLIGLFVIAALLQHSGWAQVRTGNLGLQVIRNLVHFGGQYGWFYGVALIPLAQDFAIEFTTPIWTVILAAVILGERITPTRIAAVVLGFAGILLILRPGLEVVSVAALAVLAGAVGYATSHTLTKKLSATDSALAILFYMTVIQLPLGLLPSLTDWTVPSVALWPWVVVVGLTGLSAHYCMVRAFRHADAVVVVPMDFLRLPLIAFVGLLLYGEPLDPWVFLGAGIICVGIYLNMRKA